MAHMTDTDFKTKFISSWLEDIILPMWEKFPETKPTNLEWCPDRKDWMTKTMYSCVITRPLAEDILTSHLYKVILETESFRVTHEMIGGYPQYYLDITYARVTNGFTQLECLLEYFYTIYKGGIQL